MYFFRKIFHGNKATTYVLILQKEEMYYILFVAEAVCVWRANSMLMKKSSHKFLNKGALSFWKCSVGLHLTLLLTTARCLSLIHSFEHPLMLTMGCHFYYIVYSFTSMTVLVFQQVDSIQFCQMSLGSSHKVYVNDYCIFCVGLWKRTEQQTPPTHIKPTLYTSITFPQFGCAVIAFVEWVNHYTDLEAWSVRVEHLQELWDLQLLVLSWLVSLIIWSVWLINLMG